MFVSHTSEIWTALYCQNYTKFWDFWQKIRLFKIIFDKALTPFWKTFLLLNQLSNAQLFIWRLQSFSVPKIMVVDTYNQVKSCTKHGRPNPFWRKLTVALTADKFLLQLIKIIEQRRITFVHTATTNMWHEFNVPTMKKIEQTMKPNDHTLK